MPKVPFEVTAEQYQLKSTFFANKLDALGYVGTFEYVRDRLAKDGGRLSWKSAEDFGINPKSLAAVGDASGQYFCHPNLLILDPRYLLYFRCIAALSQKGLKALSGVSSIDRMEIGNSSCSPLQARKIAQAINANLNAIYAVQIPGVEKLKALMYATAGTTIDGSWRNKIGSEGERIVRTIFLKALLENTELANVILRTGKEVSACQLSAEWLDENTAGLTSCLTINGCVIQFGSEPDIKLVDPDGRTVGGIEIKAGIDPAGALERLGAMMKSFENIRAESSEAETILVASCITDEVQDRLSSMKNVRTYIMTDVIQNRKSKGTHLMNVMRASLGLTDRFQ